MAQRICSIDGCENRYLARGLCGSHYSRYRSELPPAPTPLERFMAKVNLDGPIIRAELGPCHKWTGACNPAGYGCFSYQGKMWLAHRVAWTLLVGPIEGDSFLLHACDFPGCTRVAHLRLGNAGTNARDMSSKGRQWLQSRSNCIHGHPFDEANTYVTTKGNRQCRECQRIKSAARKARLRN